VNSRKREVRVLPAPPFGARVLWQGYMPFKHRDKGFESLAPYFMSINLPREPITRIKLEGSEQDGWDGYIERKHYLGPYRWSDWSVVGGTGRSGWCPNLHDAYELAVEFAALNA
jgi:hypothetical protein